MKLLLTVAAVIVGFSLFASSSEANDRFHGGHGGHQAYHGGHAGGYGGHSYSHARPHSSYRHSGYYGGRSHNFSNGYGYQPRYQGGYSRSYRSYGHQQHGGLHIDAGRFHLGIGGHHH